MWDLADYYDVGDDDDCDDGKGSHPPRKVQFFLTLFKWGGGGIPMFKNYVGNCRVFWRSFNNMKFA